MNNYYEYKRKVISNFRRETRGVHLDSGNTRGMISDPKGQYLH